MVRGPLAGPLPTGQHHARAPRLATGTWPDVQEGILLVPVGSTEQHGPHLPLETDTVIATAVTAELAQRATSAGHRAYEAPALPYGASGEHEDFPGTVSIGTSALVEVIVELCRSASRWANRIALVNGHGGNVEALRSAVPLLREEGRDVGWLSCVDVYAGADLHAGLSETSLMLVLAALDVKMDRAEAGDCGVAETLLSELRAQGVRAVSPNGVLGDPNGASQAHGHEVLAGMCDAAWERFATWAPGAGGMLSSMPTGDSI
ncbi:mycofactocin biosynthesis peptidyl-dipeptidase MftE [Brevibacterium sp. VCM10]|uniref:mycofactocin biosynthesis peptidyl-dipeptidase MftE n=1 Tax=Brevibacterium sp. VCM10 TaxID=1381751 RepID=UPI0004707509|nr:mycofactocin biosynthesis peptidyl-dipeptidase MftE [Brevibacterium sp. VCM10]